MFLENILNRGSNVNINEISDSKLSWEYFGVPDWNEFNDEHFKFFSLIFKKIYKFPGMKYLYNKFTQNKQNFIVPVKYHTPNLKSNDQMSINTVHINTIQSTTYKTSSGTSNRKPVSKRNKIRAKLTCRKLYSKKCKQPNKIPDYKSTKADIHNFMTKHNIKFSPRKNKTQLLSIISNYFN